MMRCFLLLPLVMSALIGCSTESHPRVLLVSMDGLRADHPTDSSAFCFNLPTLRSLMPSSTTAYRMIVLYPSSTYPCHVSMITGEPPAGHGVYSNERFVPLSDARGDYHWEHALIRAPTLYEAFRDAHRTTAAIGWPTTVGAPIDYNLPEYWEGGRFRETVIDKIKSVSSPTLLEQAQQRYGFEFTFEQLEAHKNLIAKHLVLTHKPDLLMMHYVDTDLKQHLHGPTSAEAMASIEWVDGQLSELLDAYVEAGVRNNLIICVASDHGFEHVDEEFAPNVALRNAGLLDYDDEAKRITDWRVKAWVAGGSAAIILRDPNDKTLEARARQVFQDLLDQADSPVARIIDREELTKLGSNPMAVFAIDATVGVTFSRSAGGPLLRPSFLKGTHGQLPDRDGLAAAFVISGPGVLAGKQRSTFRLIDVAPSLAKLANVPFPAVTGRAVSFDEP